MPDLGKIPEQLSAEIRMRNGDEGLPALTEGLAVEIDRAYQVMTPVHVSAGADHPDPGGRWVTTRETLLPHRP